MKIVRISEIVKGNGYYFFEVTERIGNEFPSFFVMDRIKEEIERKRQEYINEMEKRGE